MKSQSFSIVDGKTNPWKIIVLLAWPIFVEQILVSLVQAVDTAMVGSLGANATASVAISHSPNMMINGVIMALGVGFTSLIARSVGAGDKERAKDLIRQAMLLVVSLGAVLTGFALGLPVIFRCGWAVRRTFSMMPLHITGYSLRHLFSAV